LNVDIVDAMSTVKELMVSPDGTVFEPLDVVVVDDELDDEQPAATRAATARPTQPSRRERLNMPWPCERECQPPSLLLVTRIPHTPFARMYPNKPTGTPVQQRYPFEKEVDR